MSISKESKECLNCGTKFIGDYRAKFCSRKCAAIYNNSRRKIIRGKTKIAKCIRCGKEFEASVHVSSTRCLCDNCKKHKRPHNKNLKSILDCSKRTTTKILKRAGAKCAICGWSESTCDIHHIIERKNGGTDSLDNLIIVCPNCHRVIHSNKKYTISYLKTLSISNTFIGWENYYNPHN